MLFITPQKILVIFSLKIGPLDKPNAQYLYECISEANKHSLLMNIFQRCFKSTFFQVCVKPLTVSKEGWRSGVRTGVSGVCVGVDCGVGNPAMCAFGLHVSSSPGTVEVNMSRMHRHALSHISGENWEPLETTRFSRQLVPDLASCSLSGKRKGNKGLLLVTDGENEVYVPVQEQIICSCDSAHRPVFG